MPRPLPSAIGSSSPRTTRLRSPPRVPPHISSRSMPTMSPVWARFRAGSWSPAFLPLGVTPADVLNQFAALREACHHRSVDLIGGHTEIVPGLKRPILVGMMLGDAAPERLDSPRAGPSWRCPTPHQRPRHRRHRPAGARTRATSFCPTSARSRSAMPPSLMHDPGFRLSPDAGRRSAGRRRHRPPRSNRRRICDGGARDRQASGCGRRN